jgi:hypothetical protein
MIGSFNCPYCKTKNSCGCETCIQHVKGNEIVIGYTKNGEGLICGNCKKVFSYDQALDEEYKLKTHEKN